MEYENVIKKVFGEIERSEEELIHTTSELVKIPSLVGEEAGAQAFMKKKFKEIGLNVETFEASLDEIKQHPAYIDIPHSYKNRPNVVGILDGSEQFPSLILNGHVVWTGGIGYESW